MDMSTVAFPSCKLLPQEIRYATIEKEGSGFVIVCAVRKFHVYLYGQEFIAEKDHKALSWLNCMKDPNARLTRWVCRYSPIGLSLNIKQGIRM